MKALSCHTSNGCTLSSQVASGLGCSTTPNSFCANCCNALTTAFSGKNSRKASVESSVRDDACR
ncbi:hypothetical protein D3C76_1530310 [compost metagenome]